MTSEMNAHEQELASLKEVQGKVLTQQDKCRHDFMRQRRQTNQMQKDMLNTNLKADFEHDKTRKQIVESTSKVMDALCTKFGELPRITAKTQQVAGKSDREIVFVGERREKMLTPLFLLKDHMHRALLHILSNLADQVSQEHVYWLQSEFENLIASATQEVAALSQASTASSFDQWKYTHRATGLSHVGLKRGVGVSSGNEEVGRGTKGSKALKECLYRSDCFQATSAFHSTRLLGNYVLQYQGPPIHLTVTYPTK